MENFSHYLRSLDERRDLLVPGDKEAALDFAARHFIHLAKKAIQTQDRFVVALSGGSTPKAIFKKITKPPLSTQIDWSKVTLFWSDERAVPPNHPESNYHMAMEAGFSSLPIPKNQIFRMKAEDKVEGEIETQARTYEKEINQALPDGQFDLVMLGMGEDGHTASLFPKTHGLHVEGRLAIANFIPTLETWRMSLTFECINQAKLAVVYVLGKSKAHRLKEVFSSHYDPNRLPVQKIGTTLHKALFIADTEAAEEMNNA